MNNNKPEEQFSIHSLSISLCTVRIRITESVQLNWAEMCVTGPIHSEEWVWRKNGNQALYFW